MATTTGRADRPADLVILNGRITTGVPGRPEVSALAVTGERITYTGSDEGALRLVDADTDVLRLDGARVVPGLIDSHLHLVRAGLSWVDELRWSDHRSLTEALDQVAEAAKTPASTGWVTVIGGWHPGQFTENRPPTRAELDQVAPNTPVYIQQGYQRAVLNSEGLRRCGITAGAADPSPGTYHRDPETNEPTGEINGAVAFVYCASKILSDDYDHQVASTKAMMRDLNALGLTGAIDTGGGARMGPRAYRPLHQVLRDGGLTVRTRLYLHPHGHDDMTELAELIRQNHPGFGNDLLRVVGIGEILLHDCYDGAGLDPFEIDPETKNVLRTATRLCLDNGWPVNIHAIKDSTIKSILDVWEELDLETPIRGRRFSISHGDAASRETLERLRALEIGITVQDRLTIRSADSAKVWGAEAMAAIPPLRDMLELGIPIGGGTDATVAAPYNPWTSIAWMVTGKPIDGGPVRAERHRLSRDEALAAYTSGSAWFSFDDDDLGTLEPGKLADLAVLSADYFTVPEPEISALTSVLTLVGGKPVHVLPERAGDLPDSWRTAAGR